MAPAFELKTYAGLVDARLESLLPDPEVPPSQLHRAMRYSCLAPGKRLRPALCMASAEAIGAAPESVLDAACAVEMVHCFSLIHDDLPALDDDDLRRGIPTCHRKFGEATAILAGDGLFSLAFEALAASPHAADLVLRAVRILTRATGSEGLVGGEIIDLEAEGKPVSPESLDLIHRRKTGALIAAACEIGGVLGGGSPDETDHLRRFGEQVGLSFQIADDILNETSTAEQLGKAAGSDRARRKATYPSVHGIEGARAAAREATEEGLSHLAVFQGAAEALRAIALFAHERPY